MMAAGGGGSSRRGGKRRHLGQDEVALQITSMADIFTILLVFLLKSYSVSAIEVNVGKGVKLPIAHGGSERVEALKVEVGESGISIEGNLVVPLKNYEPSLADVSKDGSLKSVMEVLDKEKKKQRAVASAMGKEKEKEDAENPDRKLLIIADKKVPYKLMKMVLSSASNQDFTDFKLVVVSEE